MIIDTHAHAFPSMGGRAGHSDSRRHLRYLQHGMAFHHQPAKRLSDGSVYEGPNTLYDGEGYSLDGLTDTDFRGGGYGRFAWTVDGIDYTKQYLPPTLSDLSAPPELMLAQMDFVGIDRVVFQTGHAYGRLNRYLSEAVQRHPDRFWALAMVDEWQADQRSQISTLDRAIGELGLHGLWFQSSHLRMHGRSDYVDDPAFWPFWDRVRDLGIPVFWFVTAVEPGRDAYMDELQAFDRWAQRYNDVPVLFTHGLPLFRFMTDGEIYIPDEAWRIIDRPNIMTELLIPIFQGAIWEYPFAEAQPIIREYYERLGTDRLTWGSDMPNVERNCTYRQSLDYLRLHCDFIPPADMDKILSGNAARLMGLDL